MRDDELPGHIERSRAEYAVDLEENGGMPRDEAREKAERDFDGLFPDGKPLDNQFLRVVEDEASGERVGRVHFAARPPGSQKAFLYDIEIDEAFRGRGLGRRAMELFEEELRSRGFRRVELNVFGGNERARSLYRSLAYAELAVYMGKNLDAT